MSGRPARIPCPACAEVGQIHAIDSRETARGGLATRIRRRECRACGNRWSTVEVGLNEFDRLQRVNEAAGRMFDAWNEQ